jgi:ATP-binding cassette subfamily B protein
VTVLHAARFLLGFAQRLDRRRLARAVALMLAGYVSMPLAALAIGRFTDEAVGGRFEGMLSLAVIIAVLLVAQLMLSHFAHLDYFELAEMEQSRLRGELVELVNAPPRIESLDDPEFADSLNLIREELFAFTKALEAVLQLAGLVLQTAITAAILISLSPWLAFLPLAAVPPVLFSRWAQQIFERAREQTAEHVRLNTHLMELATDAASVKELRIFGAMHELRRRQQATWQVITSCMWRAQVTGAALRAAGQLIFAIGYSGAIFVLVRAALDGQASVGDLVLVITLAIQVSTQIAGALQLLTLLQTAGTTARRIESLRGRSTTVPVPRPARRSAATTATTSAATAYTSDRPVRDEPRTGRPAPDRLEHGIRLDRLSFAYPGTSRPVLQDICLDVPAGRTIALVGENGAGKSTLVKLLCGMYAPTDGRILIDGEDLADLDPDDWRARIAPLFQDFYRFQFTLREGIGLGELRHLDDAQALAVAIGRARAQPVVDAVPGGLAGFTGRDFDDGVELSGGQWQLVGLARCLMRTRPLLLVLDEPAAALDATAEHALFERYASSASDAARARGGITVLVSHRFSTVLMADTIAVLDGGRLAEQGSHKELLAGGGLYADLFRLQAKAYR